MRRQLLSRIAEERCLLGFTGSLIGSLLGAAFAKIFEVMTAGPDGVPRFPVAVDLALLVNATVLATGLTGRVHDDAADVPPRRWCPVQPPSHRRRSPRRP